MLKAQSVVRRLALFTELLIRGLEKKEIHFRASPVSAKAQR